MHICNEASTFANWYCKEFFCNLLFQLAVVDGLVLDLCFQLGSYQLLLFQLLNAVVSYATIVVLVQ